MMYGFMTKGSRVPELLPKFLSETFHVQLAETDVSDSAEWDDRNWDATVTCEYEQLEGDLEWSLTVYAADEVAHQPSEEQLAVHLARTLAMPVFFAWGAELPWVRRVALPTGDLTLARVLQSEETGTGFSVESAESPLEDFPDIPVARFPEVVRAFDVPTPMTDSLRSTGSTDIPAMIGGLLANWERLCVRIRSDWPPSGWYSADLFREDLEFRDQLESALREVPENERKSVETGMRELDASYRELTVIDEGLALSHALQCEVTDLADRPWYWHRRPLTLPWGEH